jgi:hypothetical protein
MDYYSREIGRDEAALGSILSRTTKLYRSQVSYTTEISTNMILTYNVHSLAWMELRLTLVELMRRFTFTPTDDNDMEPIYMFILRPKGNKFMVKPHLI